MDYRNIFFIKKDNYYYTDGLKLFIGIELKMNSGSNSVDKYLNILKYLIDYIIDFKPVINSGQTISFYSWLLKLDQVSDELFEISEAELNGDGFRKGVENSIYIIDIQESCCLEFGVSPVFPTFGQNIVISKGVYEGLGIEAVRYPSPKHMSGWWITTDLYDGDDDSLMNVHYFHVAFKRPELIKYFALPFGFRFYEGNNESKVWYDQEVLNEE